MPFLTKSGIFIREEPGLCILTYSPFSGLFYACALKDKEQLLMWLNKKIPAPPDETYEKALGPGWAIDYKDAEYPTPQMLPPRDDNWGKTIFHSHRPILINWLITGNCLLNCKYCYAQDMMHGKYPEPNANNVENIAKAILKYDPLVVVLTGGDPLVSPHLELAIRLLYNKVGIILDTSGYSLTPNHIEIFKKYNVFVRISLDSEIPKVNESLRPTSSRTKTTNRQYPNTASAAVNAIDQCIDNKIKVAVQSVATKKNRSDFEALGDKLFKLGIGGWRILMIAPSEGKYETYLELMGEEIGRNRLYNYLLKHVRSKNKNYWHFKMPVQVAQNQIPNAVVLVAPDGTFLTESNVIGRNNRKVMIDSESQYQPRLESIQDCIDMHAHLARYLNF